MKKLYSALIMASLMLAILPMIMAVSVGSGVTPTITTEEFPPQVWMCDHRIVYDDNTEPGRVSPGCLGNTCTPANNLVERVNNYAFEGEKIQWRVLVMDKNGINKLQDVFATIGDSQGAGNDIEANCVPDFADNINNAAVDPSCDARIQEENITTFNQAVMSYYTCTLTVETPESMYGQYWVTVEAVDLSGLSGTMAENEYWFFNPVIALSIDGDMSFTDVRPGTDSYSSTMLVGNDADTSSGVMLDMFISGTDFYDSSSSGAMCPTTNQLSLSSFRYFATNGAYSTSQDLQNGRASPGPGAATQPKRNCDAEGYCNIGYGIGFNNPSPFYDGFEVIQAQHVGPYYVANTLAPGAEMAVTFKLTMPEP